mmetsp:Transcript_86137/g.208747  ORF Transcript_86137/g.208747 Transcript_86137/m.208747 type:complete len:216 (+) Transcript_86137:169-816(+)
MCEAAAAVQQSTRLVQVAALQVPRGPLAHCRVREPGKCSPNGLCDVLPLNLSFKFEVAHSCSHPCSLICRSAEQVLWRRDPIFGVHLLIHSVSLRSAQDLPPHLVHEDRKPVVKEGVNHATSGPGVARRNLGSAAGDQPHGVLAAQSLPGLRGLAVGDGGLHPTGQEVKGVVIPEHHAVDWQLTAIGKHKLFGAIRDCLASVGSVHDERELPWVG